MEGLTFGILRYVTGETLNYNPHIHPQGISFQPERRFNELQELFTVIPDREKILINDIVFLDVSLINTVNSLQKLSLPYKELLF